MYEDFALVYDELMEDVPYEAWADMLHELIVEHRAAAVFYNDYLTVKPLYVWQSLYEYICLVHVFLTYHSMPFL